MPNAITPGTALDLPTARLRTACLERGLLYRGAHFPSKYTVAPRAETGPDLTTAEMRLRLERYLAVSQCLRATVDATKQSVPSSLILHLPILLGFDAV